MFPHYFPPSILALAVVPLTALISANVSCEVGVFTDKQGVVLRFFCFCLVDTTFLFCLFTYAFSLCGRLFLIICLLFLTNY